MLEEKCKRVYCSIGKKLEILLVVFLPKPDCKEGVDGKLKEKNEPELVV